MHQQRQKCACDCNRFRSLTRPLALKAIHLIVGRHGFVVTTLELYELAGRRLAQTFGLPKIRW
jgi:hypothetical protein